MSWAEDTTTISEWLWIQLRRLEWLRSQIPK